MTSKIWGALILAGVAGSFAVQAPAASAYGHNWSCVRTAWDQCYDDAGQVFNPWVGIKMSMSNAAGEICAKGGLNPGTRQPVSCQNNSNVATVCYTSGSPSTHAYGYWGNTAGPTSKQISGRASTANCSEL